jgi:hypothetical protein
LLIIPINHWLVIEFIRGYVSDLSMATLFMCGLYLWQVIRPDAKKTQVSLHWFVIGIALVLYPMSMGLTQFDPFAMGYSGNHLYNVLLLISTALGLLAWFMRWQHLATVIMLAVIANGFQLYESQNFWVYLIDPIAVIMCLVSVLLKGCCVLFDRSKTLDVKNV